MFVNLVCLMSLEREKYLQTSIVVASPPLTIGTVFPACIL